MNLIKSCFKLKNSASLNRSSFKGNTTSALSEIYQEEVNIAIWQRKLSSKIMLASNNILQTYPFLEISEVINPKDVIEMLESKIGTSKDNIYLSSDI